MKTPALIAAMLVAVTAWVPLQADHHDNSAPVVTLTVTETKTIITVHDEDGYKDLRLKTFSFTINGHQSASRVLWNAENTGLVSMVKGPKGFTCEINSNLMKADLAVSISDFCWTKGSASHEGVDGNAASGGAGEPEGESSDQDDNEDVDEPSTPQ